MAWNKPGINSIFEKKRLHSLSIPVLLTHSHGLTSWVMLCMKLGTVFSYKSECSAAVQLWRQSCSEFESKVGPQSSVPVCTQS